jgi:hypothetical protein
MVQISGGKRYEVTLDAGDAELRVLAERGAATQAWRLGLQHEPPAAWLSEAKAADRARDFDRARQVLAQHMPVASGLERRRSLSRLGRVELHAGNEAAAEETMRRVIAEHRDAGDTLELVDDSTALVYMLILHARFADARALLTDLTPTSEWPAEARYYFHYYGGLLASETADLRNALYEFDEAAREAERLDLAALRVAVAQMYAIQLARLGRWSESSDVLAPLASESSAMKACDRGRLLTNVAWALLLAREAEAPAADPVPVLAQSQRAFDKGCPEDRYGRVNVFVNLALAHIQTGDTEGASTALAQAWALDPDPAARVVLWRLDLEGRVALAKDDANGALDAYGRLEQLAAANYAPDAHWRALTGRAQALEVRGDAEDALAAYDAADGLLQEQSFEVAIEDGRETFVASLDRTTHKHLALLLDRGRVSEAMMLARRARTRVLRDVHRSVVLATLSSDDRERWDRLWSEYHALRDELANEANDDYKLAADALVVKRARRDEQIRTLRQLVDNAYAIIDRSLPEARYAAPAADEVLLLYQPLEAGWVGFAQTAHDIRSERLGCIATLASATPDQLSTCLLEPFRASIDGAQRIRVLTAGVLQSVDFHALPWHSAPLVAAKPVVYGLDLGQIEHVTAPVREKRALLVGDPLENLRAARDEVRAVGATLQGQWQVQALVGRQAQYDAVMQAISGAELFHYAGHGHFSGRGGWGSVLALASPAEITIGDILGLSRAPRWVVLSGCDTARSATDVPLQTLGLAQAFLSNGSKMVLAATRPVADETALAVTTRFYEQWKGSGDAGEALRHAQIALSREGTDDDWSSFRLFEP